jgi:nucleotide-binding universal stress UspA family protein
MIMEQQTANTNAVEGFKRILLCIDPTAASARAAAFVPQLANNETQVRIVGVVENARAVIPLGPLAAFHLSAAHALLLEDVVNACAASKELFASCGAKVEIQILDLVTHGGDVVHALAGAAQDWQADLLVMGSRQHQGLLHWVEGTLSEPLMKFAACAILVVPERGELRWSGRPQRILFAVDGSATSQEALRIGARLAHAGTELRAIHVVDRAVSLTDFVPITVLEDALVKEGNAALAKASRLFETLPKVDGVRLNTTLANTDEAYDDVPHAIMREAESWHADLIVMGTHGRRGMVRCLLGSVANRVAGIARTPLLLVRQKDVS